MAEKEVKLFSNNFMATAFALLNLGLFLLLMWTVIAEYAPAWKKHQREYYRLWAAKENDPDIKSKISSTPLEIQQVWDAKREITDRCTTCHMGVENPKMADAPQPYRTHPPIAPHVMSQIGCTVCHEGQGMATTKHEAHVMENVEGRFGPFDEQHAGWSRPMMPLAYVQASCVKCHNVMEAPVPGADRLNAGWQIVQEKGCKTCHYVVDGGAKQAPELSTAGTKFYNESGHSEAFHGVRFGYLKESLRCPQANMSPEEAKKCKAELQASPATADASQPLSGAELVKKYPCGSCHSFDTPNTLMGPSLFDVGKRRDEAYLRSKLQDPDKTPVDGFPKGVMKATLGGSGFFTDIGKNPAILDTLVTYLAGLKGGGASAAGGAAAQAVVMPNFNLNDDELQSVVTFLLGLQEQTVAWPQKSFAKKTEGHASGAGFPVDASGEALFKLAGCNACHKLDGPEMLVGPSLWDIGARQDKAYIRESILEPDKVVASGFPAGVMKATLTGTNFYQKVSIEALDRLVEYLASLQGKP